MLPLQSTFLCGQCDEAAVTAKPDVEMCPDMLACHALAQAPADTKAADVDYTDRIKRATAGAGRFSFRFVTLNLTCHAPAQAPADTKAAEADYTDRIKRATAGARVAPAAAAAGATSASTRPAEQALGYSRCAPALAATVCFQFEDKRSLQQGSD